MADGVDRLRAMLAKAGVTVEQMKSGVRLTERGAQKVAAALGIAAGDVPAMLNSLASQMRRAPALTPVTEVGGPRFSYEHDYLGNVTVRDSETGKETFLQGSEASRLLQRLDTERDEQSVLAAYAHLMETATVMPLEEDGEDYEEEIKQDWGTFNFPWSLDGRHGTGTAKYRGTGPAMKLTLVHVRDNRGKEFEPDPATKARLTDVARDFIGKE